MRLSRLLLGLLVVSLAPVSYAQNSTRDGLLFLGNKNIAPVVYLDNNQAAGLVVDIVRAMAKHMSKPVEIRAMDWSLAQSLVAQGQADALVQINRTKEREAIYDFSDPLLESTFSIFTLTKKTGIAGTSDLPGLKVGVEAGGLPQQTLGKDPRITLTVIPNFIEGFRQLSKGLLDAVVVDKRVGTYVLAENGIRNITVTGEPVAASYSAFAVKKGNLSLLKEINEALKTIKSNGTYQEVIDGWKPEEVVYQTREQITRGIYYTTVAVAGVLLLLAVAWVLTLRRQLSKRREAEQEVHRLNRELEQRVLERTAQLESANKELEAFAYSVSHDLRAPLRHIDGYVDLLVSRHREGLTEKGAHCLDSIADSTRKMGVLIDDLLLFSRQGRQELHWDDGVDMNQLVQEALALTKETSTGRTIEWTIGDLPPVKGDRALLRQVWINLLENAVKYTRPREVAKIEVSAAKEAGRITFLVADNGVGFDMQYAGKLFGVFQRMHRQEDFEGTGIGLANVQRIVSRHGGLVWAEAELDRGAKFYFTIPQSKEETHA